MKPKGIATWGLAIGLACAMVLASGCKKKSDSPKAGAGDSNVPTVGADNLQLIADTEEKERNDFKANIRALAMKGDFESLEAQAGDFRSNKSTFKSGYWKLQAFYVAFGDYHKIADEKTYANLIAQLERWAAASPESITPRLALAEAHHGYAWQARGSGTVDTANTAAEQLVEKRMVTGFNWLGEARKMQGNAKDPAFYAIALHTFLGANVDRKTYENVFEAGVKNAPDYPALYENKSYYLLPRWYGKTGEWETFARTMSQRTDLPGSKEIFARCALYLRDLGYFYEEFSGDDASWEELKTSFKALEESHPDSLEIKSIFCLICLKMCDYKEGRTQMKSLDGKVDLSVWTSKDNFLQAVGWLGQDDATLESQRQQFKAKQH